MYDKKTKPLRACVPVDPFESAPRGPQRRGRGGRRRKDEADYDGERCGAALDFGA